MPGNPDPHPEALLPSCNRLNQRQVTTDWNVRQRLGTGNIEFFKPFNGDAYALIRAIKTQICQQLDETLLKLTILARRWWSPLSSNFMLTFTG